MNSNSRIISTDEDPSLRIESSATINLRGVSTKLNKYSNIFPKCEPLLKFYTLYKTQSQLRRMYTVYIDMDVLVAAVKFYAMQIFGDLLNIKLIYSIYAFSTSCHG